MSRYCENEGKKTTRARDLKHFAIFPAFTTLFASPSTSSTIQDEMGDANTRKWTCTTLNSPRLRPSLPLPYHRTLSFLLYIPLFFSLSFFLRALCKARRFISAREPRLGLSDCVLTSHQAELYDVGQLGPG